ncbi:MAG TPA: L-seryl-tRNA(Sec) selenium transferase [Solirubrobacteraceae bacterium]|nr:L-seryl-tRNA(Sec) selenium transferase [Solirubrobacteraceae bacterium]
MGGGNAPERLSDLPAVHRLALLAARRAIDERRTSLLSGSGAGTDLTERAAELISELERSSLRRAINATGVILHTNLGRAPLPKAARDAVARAAEGYSNLELGLATGARGSRQQHVAALLCELTGAEAALVVNNGAAAVLLAVAATGGPVVVSRGQLVEIGGGFRIPEVIAAGGAQMVEVGTTNRTRRSDYTQALTETAAILRVHRSNFATVGFVQDVEIEELCGLGAPVIDDVGSGLLADGIAAASDEPSIRRSLAAGAALVCCSADKLLGGPQAGLLMGTSDRVATAARHPLARAVRIDKLSLAALEATLMLYRDPELARREIPVLAMLEVPEQVLQQRAERLRAGIGGRAEIVRTTSRPGGGALPLLELDGPAVALAADRAANELAADLRAGDPPVIARIHEGRVLLDPRTIADDELQLVIAAARR